MVVCCECYFFDFCLFFSYKGEMRPIKVVFFHLRKWRREGTKSNYGHLDTLYNSLNRGKYMGYGTNTYDSNIDRLRWPHLSEKNEQCEK